MSHLVNKCKWCNYSTPETQDWFCPICTDIKVNKFIKLERGVLVND
jgi:rubrerythrin